MNEYVSKIAGFEWVNSELKSNGERSYYLYI